ncbi:DUF2306 domain-containing protein [Zhihengliuella halotolerans]|uniref:DUF2306 domain-containing protein n=1 Tax=Zhihengliuella halotolerans TaxID=370736 RepID=UPI000C8086D0|nr:DUF2306 domain-containing protein [Zhihengliuella halotolerans]
MEVTSGVVLFQVSTALFALTLGPFQFLRRTRDRVHRYLGRAWLGAASLTCLSNVAIVPAGFDWTQGLTLSALFCFTAGWIHARRRRWIAHAWWMIGAYVGTGASWLTSLLSPGRVAQEVLANHFFVALILAIAAAAFAVGLFMILRRSVEHAASQADD